MYKQLAYITSLLIMTNPTFAKSWYPTTSLSITSGKYVDSEFRKEALASNIQIQLHYLEQAGMNIKAARSKFFFKNSDNNIIQNEAGLQLFKKIYSDSASGVFTLLFGYYRISGRDINTSNSLYPEIIYYNRPAAYLLSLGYARSDFGKIENESLKISQLTTSLGFYPYRNKLWLNVKAFRLKYNDKTKYSAHPLASWNLSLQSSILPSNITIGGIIGKQNYSTLQETMIIYNTPDEQYGGYYITSTWKWSYQTKLSLTLGSELFNEQVSNNSYRYSYISGGLSINW